MNKLDEINEKLGYIEHYGIDWDLKYYADKKIEGEKYITTKLFKKLKDIITRD